MEVALEDIPIFVLNGDWYRDEEEYQLWRRECEAEAALKKQKESSQYSSLHSSSQLSLQQSPLTHSPIYRQSGGFLCVSCNP